MLLRVGRVDSERSGNGMNGSGRVGGNCWLQGVVTKGREELTLRVFSRGIEVDMVEVEEEERGLLTRKKVGPSHSTGKTPNAADMSAPFF